MAAGPEDPNALVQIEAPFPEPMLTATTVELYDGLVATRPARAGPAGDRARPRAVRRHERALRGARGRRRPGRPVGRPHRGPVRRPGGAAGRPARGRRVAARHRRADRRPPGPGVGGRRRRRARDLPRGPGPAAHHGLRLLRRRLRPRARTAHRPPRPRRPRAPVPAAGLAASGPGRSSWPPARTSARSCSRTTTVRASCSPPVARTYLHRYGVLCGRRAVVFTTNDSAYAAAVDLSDAGVEVAAVVDARSQAPARWARGVRAARDRGAHRAGGHRHERDVARHPGARRRAGRRPARGPHRHRLRPAPGLGRLEPRRAPLQPGPRPAVVRRLDRGVPARHRRGRGRRGRLGAGGGSRWGSASATVPPWPGRP